MLQRTQKYEEHYEWGGVLSLQVRIRNPHGAVTDTTLEETVTSSQHHFITEQLQSNQTKPNISGMKQDQECLCSVINYRTVQLSTS